MHELAIAESMLEAVTGYARQAGAERVLAINLVLGERSGVVDDSLRFSFELLATGTLAEGAQIAIRRTGMRFHCAGCDNDYRPAGDDFRCQVCGTTGRVVDDGSGMLIESIEIED